VSKSTVLILIVAAFFLWKRRAGGSAVPQPTFIDPLTGGPVYL
jgi:hypothetical protein